MEIEDISYSLGNTRTLSNTTSGSTASTLTLNGGRGGSTPLIDLNTSSNFTVQNGSTGALNLQLKASGSFQIDGSGNLTISSNITETGGARALTIAGSGNGDVIFSGSNSFTGGITIQDSGKLRFTTPAAVPTTGDITVNNSGRVRFTTSGTYGAISQNLIFAPNQTTSPVLDFQNTNINIVWQGNVAMNADTRIEANGSSGVLTLSGTVSGAGAIIKQATGTLIFSGASNTFSGGLQISNGTVQLASGNNRLPAGTVVTLGQAASTNLGRLDLNGFNQEIAGLNSNVGTSTTGTNIITSTGAATLTISGGSNYLLGSGSAQNSGVITGAIALVKKGSGTQALGGVNTYSGGTSVQAGTLFVNGSITGSTAVGNNTANAILGGTGTVGTVSVTGTSGNSFYGSIDPGSAANSAGTLSTGNLTTSAGAHLSIQLGGTTAGTQYDQVAVSGTASLLAGTVFDISFINPFTPVQGNVFDLVTTTAGFNSTTISSLVFNLPSLSAGLSYNEVLVNSGNTLELQVVPEPQAWASVISGIGVLACWRRARRRRS